MKNWKKWLVAGCMAALLGIGTMGTTAMAMGGGGVDRSEAVAEEEKVPSGGKRSEIQSVLHSQNDLGYCGRTDFHHVRFPWS